MNLAALLAWFNPTRWLILGGVVLGLIAAQTGFYVGSSQGLRRTRRRTKIVEIQRQKDVAALEIKLAQANQKYQETHDALSKSAAGSAKQKALVSALCLLSVTGCASPQTLLCRCRRRRRMR